MSLPIPPGFYSNLINGYYGNLSNQEQQRLWDTFVDNYGINLETQDTVQLQTTFAQFIKGYYAKEVYNESQIALSPNEYRSRLILFNTYQSVTQMLDTLQNTVAVQGTALMHYGRWQEEYTKILSQVPSLSSGKPGTITANTTDLSKFTFGNYKFSMTDLINWGVSKAVQIGTDPSIPPTVFTNVTKQGDVELSSNYEFRVYSPSPGKEALSMQMFITANNPIQEGGSTTFGPIFREFLISSNDPQDTVYRTFDNQVAKATTLWQEILNTPTTPVLGASLAFTQTANSLWAALLASPLPAALNTLDPTKSLDSLQNIQTQLTQAVKTVLTSGPGSVWVQAAGSPNFKYLVSVVGSNVQITVHYTDQNSTLAVGSPPYDIQNINGNRIIVPWTNLGSPSIATFLNGATTIYMPGRYLGDAPTDLADPAVAGDQSKLEANIKLNDADTKSRAEVNAVLQQYIENIRSLRDSVAERSKALQAALGQDKTTLTGQTDLMTAILDSIDSVMQAVFKAGGK